jgi:hypothetical protein
MEFCEFERSSGGGIQDDGNDLQPSIQVYVSG